MKRKNIENQKQMHEKNKAGNKHQKTNIKNRNIKSLIFGKTKQTRQSDTYYPYGTQGVIPIADIREGTIITTDNRYIKLIEILPVNFYLKSGIEQQNIIYYFSSYLKIAPANLQIHIKTQKADIDAYCENMEQFYEAEENENCKEMILENAELVNYLAVNEVVTRRFFLVLENADTAGDETEKIAKLNEDADNAGKYLDYCGLECVRHEDYDSFLLNVIYSSLNKNRSNTVPPGDFQSMLSPIHSEDGEIGYDRPALAELLPGMVTRLDLIVPDDMDFTNKNYIIADGIYHSYLYISGYGYNTHTSLAWLSPLVESGDGVSLNFYLKRQHREKILPKIAKTTMVNRSRMRDVGDTRMDFEELDSAIDSGLYMKDEMNRNGEDFFYMHTLIEITADDETSLGKRVKAMETMCASMDIQVRRASYKQEQAFLSSLPLLHLDPDIERKARRNVLTTGAAAAFPFSSFELCDQKGILLGINQHNNSAVIMDFFNADKYTNANLSVLGMSGAGKTFFMQLLALRMRMQNIQIFLIAPLKGHEYRDACEAIGGRYIKLSPGSTECISIMEIRRTTMDTDVEITQENRGDSVLADKIQKLHIFFSLLYPGISQEERQLLDIALIETYRQFGITHDNNSLFDKKGDFKTMPVLADLHSVLSEKPETKKLALAISRFVSGSASSLGGHTNVDLKNKYIVLDISELGKDLLPLGMFIALDYTWDEVKKSRIQKKCIMLDEVWELIGAGSNTLAAEFTLEVAKIARGYGASAVFASQDLVDFFALEDGRYGKAILNNCRTKVVLQLEEDEALTIQKYLNLSDEETMQIVRSGRGQGLLCAGRNRIGVEIRAGQTEYDLITTRRDDLERRVLNKQNKKID